MISAEIEVNLLTEIRLILQGKTGDIPLTRMSNREKI